MNKISEQAQRVEVEIKKLEAMGGSLTGKSKRLRDSVFARFPVLFVLLSTFGLVATLYGFEKAIDQVDYFAEHPIMVLIIGLGTLTLTGSLYKKLR
ncbi:MAG: hypothetical protein KC877_04215 [Candidatus Kaiserbacteria bacterium]|nr:hypothetical protein [Candidatus Kaiserbacteria bacterium]MCB9815848.1 hypothetical protein [Candidatus Nomurabacteria bacterium]